MTLTEAAAAAGCTVETLRQRIKRRKIIAVKGNDGRLRGWLSEADIEALRAGRPTGQPVEIEALEDHIQTLREQAERDRAERDRLVQELATERQHARDLAGRLDQAHRERLADAERHRDDIETLRAELAAERGRPWWRRLRQR